MTVVADLSLEDLVELRSLDRDGVRQRFGDVTTEENVRYEALIGVDRLDAPHPRIHFFFRGDEQVMLYVPRAALADADPAAIQTQLGDPQGHLRSRTGKQARLLVWPDRGVALATDGEAAQVLEVFAPTTLDAYRTEIYQEPPKFIR